MKKIIEQYFCDMCEDPKDINEMIDYVNEQHICIDCILKCIAFSLEKGFITKINKNFQGIK